VRDRFLDNCLRVASSEIGKAHNLPALLAYKTKRDPSRRLPLAGQARDDERLVGGGTVVVAKIGNARLKPGE
jgi:hypothetical protein